MTEQEFIEEIKKLGITPTKAKLQKLKKFYHLLTEWNKKINLTRITNKEEVYLKHLYDSLTIVTEVDLTKVNTLCDVGTGAGFPGIVLAIIFKNLKIDLIEANSKKCSFLTVVKETLSLDNVQIINERAEKYAKTTREKYEIEIERVYKNNNENNKSMVIKVTDQDLIEKTGGIIQRNEWFTYNSKW